MGVEFDRILDDFTGPFAKITAWNIKVPNHVATTPSMVGYTIDRHATNSFIAVNRLLKSGADVRGMSNGDFYVRANAATAATQAKLLDSLGLTFVAREAEPAGARRLSPPRIGLWDQYGGSMDAGWARWILEQFEYPFDRVFPPQLDAGNLSAKYSTL